MFHDFVCPPTDTGFNSIWYRMHAFADPDLALLGVGVANLAAMGLLVGCVHAAASPKKLRYLRNGAMGVAFTASLPFVGAVAVIGHSVLSELTRSGWAVELFNPYLARHVVCCFIILLLGACAAASPAVAVALSACRLRLAKEQQDLDVGQMQKWALTGGAPVAAQLLWVMWDVGSGRVGWAFACLWVKRSYYSASPLEMFIAGLILLALPTAAIAALVVPVRAATRSVRLRPPPPPSFNDPSRFAACMGALSPQITL